MRSACHPMREASAAHCRADSSKAVSHSNGTSGSGPSGARFHASNAAISAGSASTA
jgi:hypothetical protein